MAEPHRRAAASSTRLTPEEITNRGFASAFRGVSETEVRNFLRRVADELVAMRTREDDLSSEVADLQEQLRNPAPVTEQQLLSSLGEETARVLRSAQDAAEEIRKRAEERAGTMVREAQEESGRLREDAQKHSTSRKEEAERKANEVEQSAEARATIVREQAERDAEALREATTAETDEIREQATATVAEEIAAAKTTSRGLVDEARTVRERVLADLGRRRSLLQAQVDELRSGRDRLLDAYRVVKRTLSDATDALAQVEARANAELAAPPARVAVPPVEGELEVLQDPPDGGAATAPFDAESLTEIDLEVESVTDITEPAVAVDAPEAVPSTGDHAAPESEDSGAAVDALFARLRASHTVDPPAPAVPAAASLPDPAPEPEPAATAPESVAEPNAAVEEPEPAAEAVDEAAPEPSSDDAVGTKTETETPAEPEPEAEPLAPDDVLRAERAEILAPLSRDLSRRAKRSLQDQQNELLDKIRTIKGKVDADDVLPGLEAQEAEWGTVLDEPLSAAYTRAYTEVAGKAPKKSELPRDLLTELATVMVAPWRQRLVTAIVGADDSDAVTERLGARFREYRGEELDDALGDALAAAWARGAFAAVPDGTLLRWVPAEVGRCPDCDDNALEPTARGSEFPTGQLFPPAHPGCRCFLALAEPANA